MKIGAARLRVGGRLRGRDSICRAASGHSRAPTASLNLPLAIPTGLRCHPTAGQHGRCRKGSRFSTYLKAAEFPIAQKKPFGIPGISFLLTVTYVQEFRPGSFSTPTQLHLSISLLLSASQSLEWAVSTILCLRACRVLLQNCKTFLCGEQEQEQSVNAVPPHRCPKCVFISFPCGPAASSTVAMPLELHPVDVRDHPVNRPNQIDVLQWDSR